MSGLSERDVRLANLICADTDEPMWSAVVITKHILASDWLAERDAAIRDEAKAEALAPIRALAEDADRAVRLPTVDAWERGWRQAHRKFGSALRALLDGGDQ